MKSEILPDSKIRLFSCTPADLVGVEITTVRDLLVILKSKVASKELKDAAKTLTSLI